MKISVVIPAYNSAAFLDETLTSICEQSSPPAEVIVVDDGSTDETASVARRFQPLVECISVENGGQGLARRIGIARSSGDWIALCDSDDVWRKEHLDRKRVLLEKVPDLAFAVSDSYSFGPGSEPGYTHFNAAPAGWMAAFTSDLGDSFFQLAEPYKALLSFNPAYLSGVVFRRDLYEACGGFLPKYSRWIGEDAEFVRRFFAQAGVMVAGDATQTWGYRRHQSNYSKQQWRNIVGKARILNEHLEQGIAPGHLVEEVRNEIMMTLGRAFDTAFREKGYGGVEELYPRLSGNQKNATRMVKYLLAKMILKTT